MTDTYQFCVKLPIDKREVLNEFKAHVAFKYGQIKGVLGPELIKALEIYNMIHMLGVVDDPEFLRKLILAGVNATGADTELRMD